MDDAKIKFFILAPNGIPIDAKSNGKVLLQYKFGLNKHISEKFLCAYSCTKDSISPLN